MAKLLVVDDSFSLANLASRILQRGGHRTVLAQSVERAEHEVRVAEQTGHEFEGGVIDGKLEEEGDGADLAVRLKAQGYKVLIYSSDEANRREGIEFLLKPARAEELLAAVDKVLNS